MIDAEVDIDGVLLDIHGGLTREVRSTYSDINFDFIGDVHIKSWGMHELDIIDVRLRPLIIKKFSDPKYIGNLQLFNGVLEALKYLDDVLKMYNGKIILSSHLLNKDCLAARKRWVDRVIKPIGIDYKLNLHCGKSKQVLNSFIIIEDHAENLRKASSEVKILIRRGHNRDERPSDFGFCAFGCVANSFVQSVNILERYLSNYA